MNDSHLNMQAIRQAVASGPASVAPTPILPRFLERLNDQVDALDRNLNNIEVRLDNFSPAPLPAIKTPVETRDAIGSLVGSCSGEEAFQDALRRLELQLERLQHCANRLSGIML